MSLSDLRLPVGEEMMCSLKAPGTAYEHSWEGSVLPTYSPLVRTRKNRSVVVGFAVDYMEAEVMVILSRLVSKAGRGQCKFCMMHTLLRELV